MKEIVFCSSFLFLLVTLCSADEIQLAFAGESTQEVIDILKKSPSLALSKNVSGNGSEVSLENLQWYVKNTSSAVYLSDGSFKIGRNCLKVILKPDSRFYIHVLRIIPPNKIDLIASFELSKSASYCFDTNTKKPLMSFEY